MTMVILMINTNKMNQLKRYILILREEEMNNNYKLREDQIKFLEKMAKDLKENPELKEELNRMLSAKNNQEMNGFHEEISSIEVASGTGKKEETIASKQYVLKNQKRAGYVDALVMALVTGFVGGISTTILLMLCK